MYPMNIIKLNNVLPFIIPIAQTITINRKKEKSDVKNFLLNIDNVAKIIHEINNKCMYNCINSVNNNIFILIIKYCAT